MRGKSLTILTELITFLFIFLFVYTGLNKLLDHVTFERTLLSAPLIKGGAVALAWFIPLSELLTAGLLIFTTTRKAGMLLSLLLMSGFTLYIGCMLIFTSKLPCSCGGVLAQMSWPAHLWFNIIFLGLAMIGYLNSQKTYRFIAINRISRKPV